MRRGGRRPTLLTLALLAISSVAVAQGVAPTSGNSGKLMGDGLELEWTAGGADFGKPYFAERTWQASGTAKARTVTFSGVLRASVPKGFVTEASMSAYLAIPMGPKKELSWRGELNGQAGLSQTLPFSFELEIPPGRTVLFSAGVSKTGGVTDMLGLLLQAKQTQAPATTDAAPATTSQTGHPSPTINGALKALAAIVAGLLAALGALVTMGTSGVSIQDLLTALRNLIRGGKPAQTNSGVADPDAADPDAADADADPNPDAKQIAEAKAALDKAAKQLKAEGKYVANGSVIDKVWYGVPHLAKEAAAWLQDVLPNGPIEPDVEATSAALQILAGNKGEWPRPPTPDPDPNWGQCGEAAEWGSRTMAEPVRQIFGPDAVFTTVTLQSNLNELGNHIANEVITPGGQRYVIDMWATMAEGKPKIYTEAEWLDEWRQHYWIGKSIRVERGDNRSGYASELEAAIRDNGVEKGIEAFRRAAHKFPGQAATVVNSYKANP